MQAIQRIVVVGDGGWGTALAMVLARTRHEVGLWSYDSQYAAHMRESRSNPRYLPGFELPASIRIDADLAALLPGAELLISAIPSSFLRDVWTRHAALVPSDIPIVSVSKGLEDGTLLRPTQVLEEILGPDHSVSVLSGPNIAREIAAGLPATSVVASPDHELARRIQQALSDRLFRVYSNRDRAGVELGGVLKNVIALAAGMCDGMELGVNAKAALVARGMIEMARLGVALGGQRATFFGLSGLGDLYTTCESRSSRNRTFGERIGRGERVEDITASMSQVAEGVKSARPVREIMHRHELSLPISEEVYLVIHEGKAPQQAVAALMQRAHKDEAEDLV